MSLYKDLIKSNVLVFILLALNFSLHFHSFVPLVDHGIPLQPLHFVVIYIFFIVDDLIVVTCSHYIKQILVLKKMKKGMYAKLLWIYFL